MGRKFGVAMDSSKVSYQALEWAQRNLNMETGDELWIIHVADGNSSIPPENPEPATVLFREFERIKNRFNLEDWPDDVKTRLSGTRAKVCAALYGGSDLTHSLLDASRRLGLHCLVVGRARQGLRNGGSHTLESVSNSLVPNDQVNVMVVKEKV